MTLQVKILLSYLALGGGAGGIYLGTNGGFGNSATEGVVEISESNSNPQLVVAETSSQEPAVPVEKPQDDEIQVDKGKEEILVNVEVTPEVKTKEREEKVLTSDETTKQAGASNNNKEAEPNPVLELQAAEEVPSTQPQELKVDIASPAPEKTETSGRSGSIKGATSKQPTQKTEQKINKPSLGPKETKDNSNSKGTKCPEKLTQSENGALSEIINLFNNGQHGIQWINCYAEYMQNKNKN